MTPASGSDPADVPPRFKILEHTADLGLQVFGSSEAEVFKTASTALFSLILDTLPSEATEIRALTLEADGYAELLCDFLNHFLYLFDAEKLVPLHWKFEQLQPAGLTACVGFGQFDPRTQGVRTYVKAVTYHQLRFETNAEGAVAEFFVDV
ncbi:MAG: archease [Acidobacteria bacterium]|nr:archease [Acidobacteriota bacterium]